MSPLLASILLLLAQQAQVPCPLGTVSADANLVVQAVDQKWLPLPGATVRVQAVGKKKISFKAVANMNGVALLSVPADVYTIEAELIGFKMKPVKNVKVPAIGSAPPQVQLMLRVTAPREMID